MSVRRPLGCALVVALVVFGLAACKAGKHSSAVTGTPAGQSASPLSSAVWPVADKTAAAPSG